MAASVWMKSSYGPWPMMPALGADDAGGHRVLEAERVADRHHPLADAQRVGVAERDGGQVLGVALDLDQREVGLRVAADDLGLVLLAVRQLHDDLVGVLDDVVVGEDEAVASR